MSFAEQKLNAVARAFAFAILCFVDFAHAATVDVDLDVQTQSAKLSSQPQVKNVAIFVLDRSWSMKDPEMRKLFGGQLPNDLLAESVRNRARVFAETAPETQVYLLPFSGSIGKLEGPYSVGDKSSLRKLEEWEGFNAYNCDGCTALYDTLAYALDFAETKIQKEPNIKVQIYAYTDGKNEIGGRRISNANLGNKVPLRYPSPHGTKAENERAFAKYDKEYHDKIVQYIVAGKMDDIQWRWLGAGEPPKGVGNIRKDEYKLSLSSANTVLKNPSVVQAQTLSATLAIPMPEEYKPRLTSLRARLSLEIGGREVSGNVVSLAPGRQTVSFQIPDNMVGDKEAPGRIRLSNIPDAWDRITLKEPTPLDVRFAAPGVLSLIIVEPGGEKYVRVGDEVRFSAKVSEPAETTWTLDGKRIGQGEIKKTFDRAGDYRMEVTAQKIGFKPARDTVVVHVLDVGVAVRLSTQKPMVGEVVDFETQVKGRPSSFSWWIDEQSAMGDKPSLKFSGFNRSGKHTVKVRASYGYGLLAESELAFDVAVKPRLTIEDPVSGSEFEFGQKIECNASVEGDFDKVVWKISGPVEETREAVVEKEKRISKPAFFTPSKGGTFVLTATAEGKAGSLPATTEVKFTVAREDVGIAIKSPASGTVIQLGPDAKNPDLKAEVRGEAIKRVRWTMLNQRTDEKKELRVTPVQNGVATCACPFDETIGDEVSLMIQAEAIFDIDVAEEIVSPEVELITRLNAALDIDAKVNGGEANGREVTFGKQIELAAICGGCVNPSDVQWFAETDGNERPIGTGPKCMAPKEEPNGESLRTVHYFAKAKLPDRKFKGSRKVSVFYCCGCLGLKASIKLPKGDDGITRTSFGLNEPVRAEIESSGEAELTDVIWDMGGIARCEGPVAEHKFGRYGEYVIAARGRCSSCGKPYAINAAQVKVEKQPVVAKFAVEPAKSAYAVNGIVQLMDKSSGDIKGRVWKANGKAIPDSDNKSKVDYKLPLKPGELTFTLVATDMEGNEAAPYSVSIRVRFGWWAIIILVFMALLIWIPLFNMLTGNGPAGWMVKKVSGPESIDSREGWEAEKLSVVKSGRWKSIFFFWNPARKSARIPIKKLGIRLADYGVPENPKEEVQVITASPPMKGTIKGLYMLQRSNVTEMLLVQHNPGYRYFLFYAPEAHRKKLEKEGKVPWALRIVLDTSKKSHFYDAVLWVLSALLLYGVAWASFRWAV